MKNILIGITSSISAYKIYELIRLFKKTGYNVKIVLSENALNFVSPLVLETLSENECFYNQFAPRKNVEHIHLVDWADVFLIAPISANTISKIAGGICDNLLLSVATAYLGTKKPFVIAPAMNNNMLDNPIIQENLKKLEKFAVNTVEPEIGFLACGSESKGRLADINIIYEKTLRAIYQKKENNNKKIVVTVGGTREDIDSVRYITNASSGKMGFCLCDWAYRLGYDVKAISTVEAKKPYEIIYVKSADDMLSALQKTDFDRLIMASAVCDFKPKEKSANKISKEDIEGDFSLELTKNPDVVQKISENKKPNQKVIGFCLGDIDLIENAKRKLQNKKLDFIVANEIITALNTDKNKVTIIDKNDKITNINTDSKENIAKKILEVICD